jgi:Tfp pilus assembly protein PilX
MMRIRHASIAPSWGHPRRAMITFVVLVCLVIITLIAAGLLRTVHSQRALIRGEARGLQADWLAESALERASARLAADHDYQGETWSISAEDLGGEAPGLVTIEVETSAENPTRRLVSVRADYPGDTEQRVRRTRRVIVDLGDRREATSP